MKKGILFIAGVILLAGCSGSSTETAAVSDITPSKPAAGMSETAASVTSLEPCPTMITQTPPPDALTDEAGSVVNPHVTICADRYQSRVGEEVVIEGQSKRIGQAIFTLMVRLDGDSDSRPVVKIRYDNVISGTPEAPIPELSLVSAKADLWDVRYRVRFEQAGDYILWIEANGEVHYGIPGPATWLTRGSFPIKIEVEP